MLYLKISAYELGNQVTEIKGFHKFLKTGRITRDLPYKNLRSFETFYLNY